MKRIFTFLSPLFLVTQLATAQTNAVMNFEKSTHDFGNIKEEGGPYEYTFKFVNTGTEPVVISNVKASCGCTTPSWSKEPVLPGKSGSITASYNSMGRPGKFTKNITVTSNTEPATTTLTINGEVTPRPKGPADWYPNKMGNLRSESSTLSFDAVKNNESKTKEMKIYNNGKEPIKFLEPKDLPKWLTLTIEPKELAPEKEGKLKGTIAGDKKSEWGAETIRIEIPTSDSEEPIKKMFISSTLEEFFPPMTDEQKAKAPKISFDKQEFDFGKIKAGDKVKTEFTLTNAGKSELIIRHTKASCGCTAGTPQKNNLKPGQSTKVDVTFDSTGKKGKTSNTVTVIANDPSTPSTVLKISAEVEEVAPTTGAK
ncbi:MAG: hypothetical protein A3G23_14945 [Bacteroidetes bacterium RIFCSPLOWO2_12_FULL_37_12]|nr:MAG: hypothetical protein A3G23_14945 [Bacteroidetes bacterium RIFCSPLOWO2_12_FULL_37_12]